MLQNESCLNLWPGIKSIYVDQFNFNSHFTYFVKGTTHNFILHNFLYDNSAHTNINKNTLDLHWKSESILK